MTIENNEVNLGNGQYSNSGINLVNNKGATITVKENQVQNCQAGIFGAMNYPTSTNLSSNLIAYRNSTTLNTYGLIWMEALPSGNSAVISDNYIYNVNNGITLNGIVTSSGFLFGSQIAGNYINPPTGSAPPVGNQPTISGNNILNKGIQLYNMHGAGVYNNFVKGSGIGINTNNNAGFYSSIGHNFFVCNTSQDVYRGFTFSGASNPSWMVKNEMNTNAIGLYLSNGGVIGDVGSLDTPNDNIWVNNTYGHGVNLTNANQYKVFFRNGANSPSNYIPTNVNSLCMIAIQSSMSANSYDCPTENGSIVIPEVEDIELKCLTELSDSIFQPTNPNSVKWMNLRGSYQLLTLNNGNSTTDSGLIAFKDSCQNSNMGKLDRALNFFPRWNKNNNIAEIQDYLETIQTITTVNESEENLSNLLKITLEKQADTSLVLDSIYLNFQTLLDSILPDTIQNSFPFLYTESKFNLTSIETIRAIANKCPITDGPAVYMARAFTASLDSFSIVYSDSCGFTGLLRVEDPSAQVGQFYISQWVKFYPNPTSNELAFELQLNEGDSAKIEFVDILGKTVETFNLRNTKGKQIKSLSNIPIGTYIVRIYINAILRNNEKLIIIK
ncbi:MAG: T9SS type A sorting domain-containing protein [Bacteroidia bacterium]|nr:T9SS type A sorting domain-containing protein [Bacteroidia bacterium]